MIIGVISDTHGPISADILDALRGVDHILHAGDIVSLDVIPALQTIAPVTAVWGNMDTVELMPGLKKTAALKLGKHLFYILHDLSFLDLVPDVAGISAVIHGHTHRADIEWRDDVLFLNPGSAGQPRYGLPASVALIEMSGDKLNPKIVKLPR